MSNKHLIIDGMLSGTGIRDGIQGGYLKLADLGLSEDLRKRILSWLKRYEDAHFHQFEDSEINEELDEEGLGIACLVRLQLPSAKISYFSNARLIEMPLDS